MSGISGCMHAGNFETYELTFLSTDIHLRVLQKLLDDMSDDEAAWLQLTQKSPAQVLFFSAPQDGMVKQSLWPLWQHAIAARGFQMR